MTEQDLIARANKLRKLLGGKPLPDAVAKSIVRSIRKPATPRTESAIEAAFDLQITLNQLPAPKRNYRFLADRKFEFDFAWPEQMIAVEIQGMAHRIKEKFEADIEKRFLAQSAGWLVLEISGSRVRSGDGIQWLIRTFARRNNYPIFR